MLNSDILLLAATGKWGFGAVRNPRKCYIGRMKRAQKHKHTHKHVAPAATSNENLVQKILAASRQPMSAYDILPQMAKKMKKPVAPPTVYRALQHLEEMGLVSRIESKNAYVLCRHPHEEHDCLFFICRKCGKATEAPERAISRLVRKEAKSLGFAASRQILEILGVCSKCARKRK
jgi:Fur family transcriptional regulator, zinc uptake regulator